MLFGLKNFIVKKWGFVLLFSILFCCKTHFLKVLKVLFYFLKGIGVNFTLDPQKERVQNKGFKRNPLKREFHKGFLASSKRTHNSNTRYKACGIGVERLAKNSNWC